MKIVKVLIDNGADLDVKIHGKPLVKFATKNGYEELVDCLIENGIDAENHNEAARSCAQPKKTLPRRRSFISKSLQKILRP